MTSKSNNSELTMFNEKVDDGYFLGYSLVSKSFRVFNTRRQQTEETYHIAFDESIDAIKFTKPSDDNITTAESERYLTDEPELVVIETDVSSDQHDQADQNDQNDKNGHSAQDVLNDGQSEHSNHIIDNLPNTKDV
ncbi:hypothetical protein Tco_0161704 [Tanacetum coccineum]